MAGGKDSASPRYIFTKMSPLTRMIFHPHDDALLKHEYDDNLKIEPVWYIPIIPMVLVNGADGIGTGWMTKIPNYNPREIVQNIRGKLDGKDVTPMMPWYKNFKGTIEDCGDQRYVVNGEIAIVGNNKLEITELPVGTWTQNYKENVLEPLLHGSEKIKAVISDYKEYNTDTTVKFVVTLLPGEMENMQREGLHKIFKLQSMISISSMCTFDELGCIRRFDSVVEIFEEYYTLRLTMYQKRKDYLEGILEAEAKKLSNQARFIMEKCNQTLIVENKKRKTIVDELLKRGYAPDPVKEWKQRSKAEEEEQVPEEEEEAPASEAGSSKKAPVDPEKEFKNSSDVQKFDYLLGMSMWMLTEEKKNELLRQKDNKLAELETLRRKSHADLWREDLDVFMEKLDQVEEKERNDEAGVKPAKKNQLGKKKINLQETMPSPVAQRVAPVISDDLKKRIHNAAKTKENKGKRTIKKENIANDDEKDEFDLLVQNKKTLKDKIGTPEEIEKKTKLKKAKDGLKQTKLNFKKKSPEGKVNGNPKKRGKKAVSDSEESVTPNSGSDVEFSNIVSPVVKERVLSKRAATKQIKYDMCEDDEDDMSSEREEELFDNDAVKDNCQQEKINLSSESEDEPPPPRNETSSEAMFDNLVGRKTENNVEVAPPPPTQKRKKNDYSGSDSDLFSPETETKKLKTKKKKVDSEEGAKKQKPKKKTKKESDDKDFGLPKKPKGKKKKVDSDSDSEYESVVVKPGRVGRNTKQTKYVFDSDDSD
jgi:DNA topoisomerase-2